MDQPEQPPTNQAKSDGQDQAEQQSDDEDQGWGPVPPKTTTTWRPLPGGDNIVTNQITEDVQAEQQAEPLENRAEPPPPQPGSSDDQAEHSYNSTIKINWSVSAAKSKDDFHEGLYQVHMKAEYLGSIIEEKSTSLSAKNEKNVTVTKLQPRITSKKRKFETILATEDQNLENSKKLKKKNAPDPNITEICANNRLQKIYDKKTNISTINYFENRRIFEAKNKKTFKTRKEFAAGKGIFKLIEIRDFGQSRSTRSRKVPRGSDVKKTSPLQRRQPVGKASPKKTFNSILTFFEGKSKLSADRAAISTKQQVPQMKVNPVNPIDDNLFQTQTKTSTNGNGGFGQLTNEKCGLGYS